MTEKDRLRKSMLARREAFPLEYIQSMSDIISNRFLQKWGGFESYALYCPVRAEVDTSGLMQKLWYLNKTVLFPKVAGNDVLWGKCTCAEDLCPGYKSVMEPVHADKNFYADVVVVPCVAFDHNCYRLGYGKGFYDRFLAGAERKLTVVLAYGQQLVPTVYPGGHDIAVDIVLTEKKIYRRI